MFDIDYHQAIVLEEYAREIIRQLSTFEAITNLKLLDATWIENMKTEGWTHISQFAYQQVK